MKTHLKRGGGFTLIELLVVIAIIGLLSSVVLASLNSARDKGNASRALSDFKQIERAFILMGDNLKVTSWWYEGSGYQLPGGVLNASNPTIASLLDPGDPLAKYLLQLPIPPYSGGVYSYDLDAGSPPASGVAIFVPASCSGGGQVGRGVNILLTGLSTSVATNVFNTLNTMVDKSNDPAGEETNCGVITASGLQTSPIIMYRMGDTPTF